MVRKIGEGSNQVSQPTNTSREQINTADRVNDPKRTAMKTIEQTSKMPSRPYQITTKLPQGASAVNDVAKKQFKK
ncbi:MAG TPA: hypothetical protein VJK48_00865 [Chlamydiales bacterium]|nr:hypothetical protein [Chlamydiales bacterium]